MRQVMSAFAAWLACVDRPPMPRATTRSPTRLKPRRRRSISPRPRRCSISVRRFRRATSTIPPIPKTPGSPFPCRTAAARPSFVFLPRPTGRKPRLPITPPRTRPALIETASSNPDIVLERSPGFGEHMFRLVIPPNNAGTLALHFQGVRQAPSLLAWTEAALVSHNQQYAVLTGLVSGLLIAATAFAAGTAILSKRAFPRWAALFLAAVVVGELSRTGFFDTLLAHRVRRTLCVVGVRALGRARLRDLARRLRRTVLVVLAVDRAPARLGRDRDSPHRRRGVCRRALRRRDGARTRRDRLGCRGSLPRALRPSRYFGRTTTFARGHDLRARHCGSDAERVRVLRRQSGRARRHRRLLRGRCAARRARDRDPDGVPCRDLARAAQSRAPRAPCESQRPERIPAPAPAAPVSDNSARRSASKPRSPRRIKACSISICTPASSRSRLKPPSCSGFLRAPSSSARNLGRHASTRRTARPSRSRWSCTAIIRVSRSASSSACAARAAEPSGSNCAPTMTGQSTEAERCLGLIADVTARKNAETSEAAAGPSDALTGLGTRAALISFLDAAPEGLKRSALALFDIERFKAINDSLGQNGGDALLVALVERIEAGLASKPGINRARLFRVGGGMFAVTETDVADPISFGRRIFDMMSAPFFDQWPRDLCPGQRRRRGRIEVGPRARSSVQCRTRAR